MTSIDSKQTTLEAIAEFTNGGAWSQAEYSKEGVPVVRVTDIKNETVGLSDCKFLPKLALNKYARHLLRAGDLVICTVGSHPTQPGSVVGRAAVVPETAHGALLNQNAVCIRSSSPGVDQGWLGYLGRSQAFHDYIISCARGSANQVRMAIGLLKEMPVDLPSLAVQQRIAGILSAYDELIENNQRRIKILESMTRGIYREWFINYRFPGHEDQTRVVSPLGKIPQGWEVMRVTDAMNVNPRVAIPRDGEKPFVPMGCLSNDSMLITNIESRTGNSGAKFQNGDTLFARITPCLENGKTGFVQFLPDANAVAFGSTEFIVLRSRSLTPEFVYCLARSDEFREVAIKSMSGASGRQRVQEQCFNDFHIAQPPRALLDQFSAIVSPSFRLIYKLHKQIQNLRRTRDLLLPRLLSGQIDLETA
ncbi:MAG TPA: restriction endonuclease subunit S [Geobacter sp.]|nr:restriction endonuclease subunit S [Geobacter sp.]